jgi:hypothetical protein
MPTSIFEAPPYDPRRERRRKALIALGIAFLIFLAVVAYLNRYWPEERIVHNFFAALQQQQFEKAYGIWMHDDGWKQHPDRYAEYPFGRFLQDWGPSGEWGPIRSYRIKGVVAPPGRSSGVVAAVIVNDRKEPACVWVQARDKTMSFPPEDCQ